VLLIISRNNSTLGLGFGLGLGLGLEKTLKFKRSAKRLSTGQLWITAFYVDLWCFNFFGVLIY